MDRYRQKTNNYVLKWPKEHQKVPKFNKINLSTLSDHPPLRLIHIFKINNIHIKKFFYPHAATPPPLSTFGDPPPLIHKKWIICRFYLEPFPYAYQIMIFWRSCILKVFCELGTSLILWVRDICDIFSKNEKSMITNDFTICKAKVQFIFISKTQDNNYNIENNVFS